MREHGLRDLAAWVAIGEHLVGFVYGADTPERPVRRRDARRYAPLALLAAAPNAPLREATLCSVVNVSLLAVRYPFVLRAPALSPTHLVDSLRLPEPQREALLRRAHLERWSTRAFRSAIAGARGEGGARRGRPRQSAADRARSMCARALRPLEMACTFLSELAEANDDSRRAALPSLRGLDQLLHRCFVAAGDASARGSAPARASAPAPTHQPDAAAACRPSAARGDLPAHRRDVWDRLHDDDAPPASA
ncbi:MAG: hypothetical protein IT376_13800 [Polyangiaceae bacterium]|nr:hypothetical protein [Polyangiaceae bacterium]